MIAQNPIDYSTNIPSPVYAPHSRWIHHCYPHAYEYYTIDPRYPIYAQNTPYVPTEYAHLWHYQLNHSPDLITNLNTEAALLADISSNNQPGERNQINLRRSSGSGKGNNNPANLFGDILNLGFGLQLG